MPKNAICKLRVVAWSAALFCALPMVAPAARSQQSTGAAGENQPTQNAQPIPAYHSPLASSSDDQGANDNSQKLQPDTNPLSGAQYLSLGTLRTTRSYWQPSFDLTGSGDSNPQNSPTSASWGTWTSVLAGVDIHHTSGTSDFLLSYLGGGMFSTDNSLPSGAVQEMGVTEKVSFRRSVLSLIDQLDYLPEAGLGFGGVGGLPLSGSGSTGLSSSFVNNQSILSGYGQHLENSSVVQLEAFLTPRSSITMAGGYSLLHFFSNNLINSGDVIFQGGYNYQLSEHNTIALLYGFNQFRFSNSDQLIDSHSVQASFARRVTGRLSFQIGAGPEFTVFTNGGSSSGSGTGIGLGASTGSSTQVNWSLNSAVIYQYQRTALNLAYSHGVSSGSGVVAGALRDTVTGGLTRRMSRTFSSGLTVGYARNQTLSIPGVQSGNQNYDYWFAGASFAHPLSQTLALRLSYEMQYQTSNAAFCIGPTCGTGLVSHVISIGLNWRQRPLLF
jgi:hypothetical protein